MYPEDVNHSNDIPLVFSTDYFPQRYNAEINQAVLRNWHYISNNHNLRKIFPCPPILALRRIRNLGERLIKAKITSNQNTVSLTPDMQNRRDASIEIGTCPMSPTLKDMLDLLAEN